jgi:O-acetyl-ADP-ribose deacetylase
LRCHLSSRWDGEARRRLRRHRPLPHGIGCANAFDISTARYIIHAVGPIYSRYTAEEARRLLRSAYVSAIQLAVENGCTSLAFPAISTGIYGYPLEEACKEAVDVCWAEAQRTGVGIKLVAFDGKTADCLRRYLSARMKVPSSKD